MSSPTRLARRGLSKPISTASAWAATSSRFIGSLLRRRWATDEAGAPGADRPVTGVDAEILRNDAGALPPTDEERGGLEAEGNESRDEEWHQFPQRRKGSYTRIEKRSSLAPKWVPTLSLNEKAGVVTSSVAGPPSTAYQR